MPFCGAPQFSVYTRIQSVRDLGRVSQQISTGQWALLNPCCQRLPLEILHHQIINSVLVADVIERADVRMIEAGNGARFTLESLPNFRRVR